MRIGHGEAQAMFLEIGDSLGFEVRKSYSSDQPTDGVWLFGPQHGLLAGLPAAAIEVVVSESAKAIDGSIHRLEATSPALGVILLQEDEIARRLTRLGLTHPHIESVIARDTSRIDRHLRSSNQRIQRWSFAQLRWVHRMTRSDRAAAARISRELALTANPL